MSIFRPPASLSRLPDMASQHLSAEKVRSVLIVSDSRLVREALQNDIARISAKLKVLGTASYESAQNQVAALDPDAVVLDSSRSDMVALPSLLCALSPRLRIIVVASTNTDAEFLRWAEAGVHGYVDQDSSAINLADAIQHAARGEVLCSSRLAGLLVSRVASLSAERNKGRDITALTPREKEILGLIADGMSNKLIASRLSITPATAKNHVHSILDKLGLQTRGQASAYYHRNWLVFHALSPTPTNGVDLLRR